jgi:hypothetical protein
MILFCHTSYRGPQQYYNRQLLYNQIFQFRIVVSMVNMWEPTEWKRVVNINVLHFSLFKTACWWPDNGRKWQKRESVSKQKAAVLDGTVNDLFFNLVLWVYMFGFEKEFNFSSDRLITKGTLLGKQSTFSAIFLLPFQGFFLKNSTLCTLLVFPTNFASDPVWWLIH